MPRFLPKILVAAGMTGVVLVLLAWLRPGEPRSRGHRLSYWVERLWVPEVDQEEARAAVRELGSNAIPSLLDRVRRAAFAQKTGAAWSQMPPSVQAYVPLAGRHEHLLQNQIPYALSLLGAEALPALSAAAEEPNEQVQLTAARALQLMEPPPRAAFEILIHLSQHTNAMVRLQSLLALRRFAPDRPDVIPVLIDRLQDPNRGPDGGKVFVRETAARVLGQIGPQAKPAVPELHKMLTHPENYARREAAVALWRITHDTNLLAHVVNEMDDARGPNEFKGYLSLLGEMGPLAKPAVPAILQGHAKYPQQTMRHVRAALRRIDPESVENLDRPRP